MAHSFIKSIRKFNRETLTLTLMFFIISNSYTYGSLVKHQGDFPEILNGASTYKTSTPNQDVNFFVNRTTSDNLLVFLPGATNRKKGITGFQRSSWHPDISQNLLCFRDPTIRSDNSIILGWFHGSQNDYALEEVKKNIIKITSQLKIKLPDVTIFGSSGGGFNALQLSNDFKESIIIAINPQIYLPEYQAIHFQGLLKVVYGDMTQEEVLKKFPERFKCDNFDLESRSGKIIIFQNDRDLHHINNHLNPMLALLDSKHLNVSRKGLSKKQKLNINIFSDEKLGHSPPGKEKTLDLIQWSVSNDQD